MLNRTPSGFKHILESRLVLAQVMPESRKPSPFAGAKGSRKLRGSPGYAFEVIFKKLPAFLRLIIKGMGVVPHLIQSF
jgi:hypothetical protein